MTRWYLRIPLFVVVILTTWASSEAQQSITRTPFYVYLEAPNSDALAVEQMTAKLRAMRGVRLVGVCKTIPCDRDAKEDVRISMIAYEAKFRSGNPTNYWNFSIVFAVRSPKKDAYYIVNHWLRTGVFGEDLEKTCEEIVKDLDDGVFEPIRKETVRRDKTANR
jgi:hypothetical protein